MKSLIATLPIRISELDWETVTGPIIAHVDILVAHLPKMCRIYNVGKRVCFKAYAANLGQKPTFSEKGSERQCTPFN